MICRCQCGARGCNIRKLYDGAFPRFRKVRTFRTAALEISGPAPISCEVDGECIRATPMRLGVLPRRICVVVPA
jgi:diacylglycerol kinase family enzyme